MFPFRITIQLRISFNCLQNNYPTISTISIATMRANRCFLTVRSFIRSSADLRFACSYLHSTQSQVAICMASECAVLLNAIQTVRYIIASRAGHKISALQSPALFFNVIADLQTGNKRLNSFENISDPFFVPLRAVESFFLCFGSCKLPLSMV